MDVKDRTTRIDVLTIVAPVAKDAATASPVPQPNGGFADSLQKSQSKSASKASTDSQPSNSSANEQPDAPGGVSGTDERTPSSPLLDSRQATNATNADHAETAALADEDWELPVEALGEIEWATQQFLTTVAAPNSNPAPQDSPTSSGTPAGLAEAISATIGPVEPVPDAMAPASELPQIPAALQLVLSTLPNPCDHSKVTHEGDSVSETEDVFSPNKVDATGISPAASLTPAESSSVEAPAVPESPNLSPIVLPNAVEAAVAEKATSPLAKATLNSPAQADAGSVSQETPASLSSTDRTNGRDASLTPISARRANHSPLRQQSAEDLDTAEVLPWSVSSASDRGELRTESAAPHPSLHRIESEVVNQLQPALARAASSQQPLSILLRPPELGAVRIDISQQGGILAARLEAETSAAHRLLSDSLPLLREALTPLGVAPEQIQVLRMEAAPAWDAGWQAGAQGDAANSGERHDAPAQQTLEPEWSNEPELDDRGTRGVQTRTSINLKI